MKNFYKHTLLAVSIALFTAAGLASCTPEDQTDPVTPTTKTYDVYVTGIEFDSGYEVGKLWKNGKATTLSTLIGHSQALSVFVAEDYVYVSGVENHKAKLWKIGTDLNTDNLTQVALSSSSSYAYSVFVAGDYVYVAGKEGSNATLWKIGTNADLNTKNLSKVTLSSDKSFAYSVFVAGDYVYMAGKEENAEEIEYATLWKLGTDLNTVNLTKVSLSSNASSANSVFVEREDVYVAGKESSGGTNYSKLWKINKDFTTSSTTPINNVTLASNTSRDNPSNAASVFVSGNVVYIAGGTSVDKRDLASTLWKINKDLTLTSLTATDLSNESPFSVASSVYVLGDDAYIAGSDWRLINNNPHYFASWWKVSKGLTSTNPTYTALTDGLSMALTSSIFVKEQ